MVLCAGYGSADITPPLGIPGRVGISHHLNLRGDPISVRALWFREGSEEVLQLTAEVVGLTSEVMADIQMRLQEALGLDPARVILCSTHTHAGPWVWKSQAREAEAIGIPLMDASWLERVVEACAEAGAAARKDVRPTVLKVGRAEPVDVASNRLSEGWRSSFTEDPEKRARPVGPIDPELRLLALCELDGNPRVLVVNYACHPTAFGGGEVPFASPDFPHYAERRVARVLGKPIPLVYWMGCAGDINTGKFCAEGNDEEVAGIGVRLGDAVLQAWARAEVLEGSLGISREQHHFEPGQWMESEQEARARFRERSGPLLQRIQKGEALVYQDYHEWRMALKRLNFCKVLEAEGMPVELVCFRLGPLRVLFVPGEWFHRIGGDLAAAGKTLPGQAPGVWVTTLANFDLNYVPDPGSFNRKEWYGVAPAMRILSDAGILAMIEAAGKLVR